MKKDGAAKRRRGLSNVTLVTRFNIGDAAGSNNPAEGGAAPSRRSGSRRSGDIARFALGVGRDSATAGKRIKRILNGDPADRSSWAPPLLAQAAGILVQRPRGLEPPEAFSAVTRARCGRRAGNYGERSARSAVSVESVITVFRSVRYCDRGLRAGCITRRHAARHRPRPASTPRGRGHVRPSQRVPWRPRASSRPPSTRTSLPTRLAHRA